MRCSNLREWKRHVHNDICDNTLPGHAPSTSEIVTARLRPRKGSSRRMINSTLVSGRRGWRKRRWRQDLRTAYGRR